MKGRNRLVKLTEDRNDMLTLGISKDNLVLYLVHLPHEIMTSPILFFCACYRYVWNKPHSLVVFMSSYGKFQSDIWEPKASFSKQQRIC